jgi:hypothetical protein
MVKIENGKHLNMNAIIMKNENLQVKLLPDLGFKMASIVHLPKQKEFLFQPTKNKYSIPNYNDKFEKYDTSGLDDVIPTIDECTYPHGKFKGKLLPDHGDVWSMKWDVGVFKNKVVGNVALKSLPLELTRHIELSEDSTIRLNYKVKNLGDEEVYFIWALHGLNNFDDYTEFIFQEDMVDVINVYDNEDLTKIDLKKLDNYETGRSYKYYFLNEFNKGEVGLNYTREKLKYIIKYDANVLPYLGIWITKGGFKGEHNCALEPSNGFYDSLSTAYLNKKLPCLSSHEEINWSIEIQIIDY